MIASFQQLSTTVKILIILGVLSVLTGIVLLLAFGLAAGPKKTTKNPGVVPAQVITETPKPTATKEVPQSEQLEIQDQNEAQKLIDSKKYTSADKTAAYQHAADGYITWCRVIKGETLEQRTARLKPYFSSSFDDYDPNYPGFSSSAQQCILTSSTPSSIDGSGNITVSVNVQMATLSEDGGGRVQAQAGTVVMAKENGKWVITEISQTTSSATTGGDD